MVAGEGGEESVRETGDMEGRCERKYGSGRKGRGKCERDGGDGRVGVREGRGDGGKM